uniref:Methyltetrahydroprotoberberine 14-monooxygenase n=1 Tax=Papaver somniferum TaxID=3469 RepID=MSH_PAPSO|nr:RecName: Full=Methyltetrahydroprotoberberine 14-monooxygenase; AltName: Full=(S)-cis-N-methylstylopine 14-hydroxylase; AltName: Full=(S)-cis-N-methyltetrahydroprotoberberine-14-hydroxylase; AltName: Full=Cytochrome P450 82N4; AltName: Full=Methyltetrahydroprotoberberine 14-hydroxylase; AltName: Full=N-methylstylopine hydroxylase; Short=PsMSH [Papaver somniferum]AGC92398.1 (S)-cis-N-methylstylopine 14-hydroxylase [Papaver somniferum]
MRTESIKTNRPMDLLLQYLQPISVALVVIALVWNYGRRNPTKKLAPEASGGRPIMGHLHLFNDGELTHRKLGAMADTYGPVFNIRFGSHKTLVVSDWEIVKECFTTNDKLFSNRPGTLGIKLMFYDADSVGYAPYGAYWRDLRKISTLKLLSNHRIDTIKHLRSSEVESCFESLYSQWGNGEKSGEFAPVRMDSWLGDLTFNVVARIVAGKKNFSANGDVGAQRYKAAMDEAMRLMRFFAFSDVIPSLSWLDNLRGLVREMKKCASEIDSIMATWVEEHRVKRNSGGNSQLEHDFIDVCLDIMEHSSLPGDDPDLVVKSTCLDMILGGSDTTTVTLTWAMSLLLNHPQVLQKAKEELETQVGKNRQVDDSDIPNLPFIQAIIKETMRLYPAGPLIERRTMEDCEVAGYQVPAGTRLLVNVWKMQRDGNVYKGDPLEFRPDRFLTSNADVDLKGQHYELIPFGAGRRICPGVSFAVQLMHLVLARLLHEFEITTVEPETKVDMAESGGLLCYKIMPLEVLIKPRLEI